ncbi:anthrone oxygenase family protein [Kribbella sp. NPDC056861]|uniref:anthrone oxygenase family protein n=1 Tax=Kribbella sp. NPDC056861 TaxID=3154857 RepID=UPI003430A7C6
MNLTKILIFSGLVGSALIGGVSFTFGTAIMGSLQRMPAGQGAAAMNLINARIQNPLFLLIFCGTALVCLAVAILALVKDTPGKWWVLAGSALYLIGVIVVSFAVNIPLNEHLATIDPYSAAGAAEWQTYLTKWNPANNVRAITGTLAVIAFALALHAGAGSQPAAESSPQTPGVGTVWS